MNCNIELHNELKESGEIHCPFCDEKLQDCSVKEQDLCCDLQDVANEDINFHKNKEKNGKKINIP